jgi:hypothetical protein
VDVYNLGQKIRISAEFTDADGAAADPTAVYVVIKAPDSDGVTYTYGEDAELAKDAVGHYHVDQALSSCGIWTARWYSTGNVQAGSADRRIRVRETVCD